MSGALMDKVWGLFGMDAVEEEEYDEENAYDYEDEEEEVEVEDKKLFGRKNNKDKVVAMPQANANAIQMVISQPTNFEQSDEICSFLKEKKSVIVNLEYVNKEVARRIVDFISGGVYALDGYIQKVSNSIFLVAPSNYEITNEMAREEMKSKLSVSWLKNNGVN
ncbi:MAG: cell division protein SepF [Clostridia bacterium]|nr:cell division protein SepF [Clostridia bacterium]